MLEQWRPFIYLMYLADIPHHAYQKMFSTPSIHLVAINFRSELLPPAF